MLETASIVSAVIAGVILLIIERIFFAKKEKVAPSQQNTYPNQIIRPIRHRPIARIIELPGWVTVILSVFLPPLSVYLEKGMTSYLWVNIGLTLLWLWPGVFHALFIVLASRTKSA